MKEKDVRERVESFLRSTVRTVVVPASMGLGLTLVGCSGSSSESRVDAPIRQDTAADIRKWDGLPTLITEYGVPFKLDTNNDNAAYRPDTPTVVSNPDSRPDNAPDASAAERWETQPSDARDVPIQDATIDGVVSDGMDGR